jgi:hypothetical protein
MKDITAGEHHGRELALEAAGATLLGKMLFAFSRVDVSLGLCLVWVDAGSRIESLTKQVVDLGFGKRLEYLEETVNRVLPEGHPGRPDYFQWIRRAHAIRKIRNELVHGRWGVDAVQNNVLNVVGLPTSPEQREIRYKIADLEAVVREMEDLHVVFGKLRRRWPLSARA